ncbi:MAG: hypothetical protein Alpg2KO_33970 [Alphaproteobacteria bacterium]
MKLSFTLRKKVKAIASAAALALATTFGLASAASAVSLSAWSISGPGSSSVAQSGNMTTFNYELSPGFSGTWTASATVLESGTYSYDWDYTGFHSYFRVTAFLETTSPVATLVDAGPESCCTAPSAGFSYSGSDSFAVTAGDIIGFKLGGSHFDSAKVLKGELKISAVPVPAAGFLLVGALGGLGLMRRRKKA